MYLVQLPLWQLPAAELKVSFIPLTGNTLADDDRQHTLHSSR